MMGSKYRILSEARVYRALRSSKSPTKQCQMFVDPIATLPKA